jgi:hypothetical protein
LIYRVDEPSTQLSDDGNEAGTDQAPGARKAIARQQDVGRGTRGDTADTAGEGYDGDMGCL